MSEKSIVVYGPQGCGKTRNASAIAKAFGLREIVDDWSPRSAVLKRQSEGTLFLTSEPLRPNEFGQRVYSFDEAMSRVRKQVKA